MAQIEHKTLDSLCRYMTDVNGRGETWHVVVSDGLLEIVADFPPESTGDDDVMRDVMRVNGWIVTRGLDEPSVLANLTHARVFGRSAEFDVPLLRGLDESVSVEEIRIRLAAYGY